MENNNINIENDPNMNYVQIIDNFLNDNNNINLNNNNNNNNINNQFAINLQYENKIFSYSFYAFCRLILLFFCYLFSKSPFNSFLSKLVVFLLIHEALAITNFILMSVYLKMNNNIFPEICLLFNTLNRMIFFVWFLYGNLLLIFDENEINSSIKNNALITYYIIMLILIGYFMFADYLFLIILLILFFPCIIYILFNYVKERQKLLENVKKINSMLKEKNYEEYSKEYGKDYMDICVICSENFKNGDKIIVLPCNNHHVFHGNCIKTWIKNKTICPMCRKDLNLYVNNENEEESQINII